jgi:hypothetical protein
MHHQPKPPTPKTKYALADKIKFSDGTNYIGVYLGMIAEHDGHDGVEMFSASSGELLKRISFQDFQAIFVDKTKPEYPKP